MYSGDPDVMHRVSKLVMFIQFTWFGTINSKRHSRRSLSLTHTCFNFFSMDSLTKSKIGLMVKIKGERMVVLSTFQENAIGIILRYANACLKRSFLKVVLKSSSLLDRIRMAMTLP